MDVFIILIEVMISEKYTHVKTDQIVHFNICLLFNYTSITDFPEIKFLWLIVTKWDANKATVEVEWGQGD